MSVISFPQSVHDRREHLFRVAASAAALGAFAQNDDDAIERLESVTMGDAQVVAIRR